MEGALRDAVRLLSALALPVLGALLGAGLVTGLVQGFTRVRDRSISTVPRILAVGAIAAVCGGWSAARLVAFASSMGASAVEAGRPPAR